MSRTPPMLVSLLALGALAAPWAKAAESSAAIASTPAAQQAARDPQPPAQPAHLGFALELNWEAGGNQVARVYFTDGSTRPMFAGDGWTAAAGVHYRLADSPLDLCALAGLKYLAVSGANGNIKLTRELVEARADVHLPHGLWIGAGPVWHTGIKLDADGFGDNVHFSNALGATAKAGWRWFAVTYTAMKYKDSFGDHFSADSLGVTYMGRF